MSYSTDLRTRATNTFLNSNQRYQDVASTFQIGVGTLHRWVQRFRTTGKIGLIKQTGRPRLLCSAREKEFKDFAIKNSDKTLQELSEKWLERSAIDMSTFSVSRALRRLGLSYKKNFSSK